MSTENLVPARSWLEIDMVAVLANFERIAETVAPSKVMPILKANAYGLGVLPLAKALAKAGADRIGLAEIREALPLQGQVHCPLQIMGGLFPEEIAQAVSMNLICPVSDLASAELLSQEGVRQHQQVKIHLKIDTGMGRLGIPHFLAKKIIPQIQLLPNLYIEGAYTHFANANNSSHPKTREQMQLFNDLLKELDLTGLERIHLANSDAINNFPDSYANMVRTGINLYGVFDLLGYRAYSLKPTLTLKSRLLSKRLLPAGYTIGYSSTHTLFHDTWVGTIPMGYADGIPLSASNSGRVLIKGKECPILGRISMDYITVDLNQCSDVNVGDEVVLFGKSGDKHITVEDWARIKQSHPYDIICSLGTRVERRYLGV